MASFITKNRETYNKNEQRTICEAIWQTDFK